MRRGRRMLLTLLAIALPTAALAHSVDFDTGTFKSGTITGTFNTSIKVTEAGINNGALVTITIDTGALMKSGCPMGIVATCYNFSGGSVTVNVGGHTVFSDSLDGGLTVKGNGSASIDGFLSASSQVLSGSGMAVSTLDFKGTKILSGSSDVSFNTPVPEPSTLLSLGTGLIGFAGMMRRKLPLRR